MLQLVENIYWAVKGQGKYSLLATDTEPISAPNWSLPRFSSGMEQQSMSIPPPDGMLVHCKITPPPPAIHEGTYL